MAIQLAGAARAAAVDGVVDLLDAGIGTPTIQIRSGAPGDPDSAATGTLLASLAMDGTNAFGNATTADPAVATANAIAATTGVADGTAGHFVALDRDDAIIFVGTVTATGGGGDIELSSTSITTGGAVTITSFAFRAPQTQA